MTTTKDSLNAANPNTLADQLRALKFGDILRALPTFLRRAKALALATSPYLPVGAVGVDQQSAGDASALLITEAYARAGAGTPGFLAVQAKGVIPAAGQISIMENGQIATATADAWTDVDVAYQPDKGDVIEHTVPVDPATGILLLPASITGPGAVTLLEAEAMAGGATGKKIILAPNAAAPAAGNSVLRTDKAVVFFAIADAVTSGRVKVLCASAVDVNAALSAAASIGLAVADTPPTVPGAKHQPPIGETPPMAEAAQNLTPDPAAAQPPPAAPAAGQPPPAGTSAPAAAGAPAPAGAPAKPGVVQARREALTMTPTQLKDRLDQAKRGELKELFGTDNKEEIARRMQAWQASETKAEETRRANLDENTRLKEDLDKERKLRQDAEQKATRTEQHRVADQQGQRVFGIARLFIKDKFIKHAARDMAEDLAKKYTSKQLGKLTDVDLKKWFGGYVKANPEMAIKRAAAPAAAPAGGTPAPAPAAPPARKVPATTGPGAAAKPGAPTTTNTKTPRPNQPNSMSADEWKKYKRDHNINF